MHSLLILACILGVALATVPAQNVKSFGSAIKNGHLYMTEETIFEHSCDNGGVITEMWFTGGWDGFARTRVRLYIDGETVASIDFRLYMAHGIGFDDDATVTSTPLMGKNAHGGGIYNTFRIPFGKSIKITAILDHAADNVFWFIVRGLENMPVILGDLELPRTARLKLYKNQNVTVAPYGYTTLMETTTGGAIMLVTIAAESADLNFLEACFRVYLDGDSKPTFLSSGTEDFFLSAFYYNGGQYFTSEAGLTHMDTTKNPNQLSMFKTFIRDPIIFAKGAKLVWRNMEDGACPTVWGKSAVEEAHSVNAKVAPMTYTSYTWVYEW